MLMKKFVYNLVFAVVVRSFIHDAPFISVLLSQSPFVSLLLFGTTLVSRHSRPFSLTTLYMYNVYVCVFIPLKFNFIFVVHLLLSL